MDNAALLAPITADQPCGSDLSFSPEMDAVAELRREDDPTLDQGAWVSVLKTADWRGVLERCETLLATRSKDLRVAGWLVDARARLQGFEGLAEGVELMAALVDTYWDLLHPRPDEGEIDQEERIGNLRWLGARVEQLVPTMMLVSKDGRHTTLAALSGARARRLTSGPAGTTAAAAAENAAPGTEPPLTLEAAWRDVNAGGRRALLQRRAEVRRAHDALVRLQTAVDAQLQDDAPSFAAARAAVERAHDELGRLERECGFASSAPSDPAPMPTAAGVVESPNPGSAPAATPVSHRPGRIDTREQAVEQLRLVATFFRASEPHSPVAYLADKAVQWSEMPLHEWLRAVVKDGVALSQLEDLLGVDKKPDGT